MSRTFKPRHFGGDAKSPFSLATMSMAYWDWAEEFYSKAIEDFNSEKNPGYSKNVFLAIIMYFACLESLINEELARVEKVIEEEEIKKEIAHLRTESISNKFEPAYELLPRSNGNLNSSVVNNFRALKDLRNLIFHYNPEPEVDILNWPTKLRHVLGRTDQEPFQADWTITFRKKKVLEWYRETIKKILEEFIDASKIDKERFFNLK